MLLAKRDLKLLREAKRDKLKAACAAILEQKGNYRDVHILPGPQEDEAVLGSDNFVRVGCCLSLISQQRIDVHA